MRCISCGFDNPSDTHLCLKCGQPLGGSHSISENVMPSALQGENLHSTVIGSFAGASNTPRETVKDVKNMMREAETVVDVNSNLVNEVANKCHNCGYPLLGANTDVCPNCNARIDYSQQVASNPNNMSGGNNKEDSSMVVCSKCKEQVPAHYHYCPKCGEKIHLATEWHGIRNIVKEEPLKEKQFSLTIIPDVGENINIKECEFSCIENDTVILNRDNTDSSNRSITSGQQAEIGYENGHWYIKNLSDNESTFMVVNRKLELQDGDTILLGYRYFKFNKK